MTCVMAGMWLASNWFKVQSDIQRLDISNNSSNLQSTAHHAAEPSDRSSSNVEVIVSHRRIESPQSPLSGDNLMSGIADVRALVDDINQRWERRSLEFELDFWKADLAEILDQIQLLEKSFPKNSPSGPVSAPPVERIEE